VIKVENLSKAFGSKLAVNDISFTVERGEVLGFLGPNGAGKSTTMRMVTGFIPPTSGRITVGGHDVMEDPIPAKRMFGYLPENAPGYADMTVEGFLKFAAELRGLRGDARKKAVHRAVELCFLENVFMQSVWYLGSECRYRKSGSRYVTIVHAMEDDELRAYTFEQAHRELISWRKKYSDLNEFEKLFVFIDKEYA